ncbi:MAG: HAD family phosphatase [Phycisphaerales bacterium]|nr:HAD family phosphatase [Phycisphaerales bacterium]
MARSCVIFDFDGVIADTEAVHLAAYNATFRAFAAEIGGALVIAPAAYYGRYIVYGDHDALFHMLKDNDRSTDDRLIERLMQAKGKCAEEKLSDFAEPLPGVRDLLAWLERNNVPRAICSGARKDEVLTLLEAFKLRHHFDVVITIEDVRHSKPEPEGYNKAFDFLNVKYDAALEKGSSLVIEDSEGGCAAGRAAGIRVLGVATSVSLERLRRCTDFAVENLAKLDHKVLAEWLGLHQGNRIWRSEPRP